MQESKIFCFNYKPARVFPHFMAAWV